MMTTHSLTRRHLLFAAAGISGAALALPAAAARRVTTALDLHDPRVALDTYVKLRGSIGNETVFQPYEGDLFLVADGKVGIPLCGFKGLQKSVWRKAADGSYTNQDYDIGFYVDYETRAVLKTWRNPVTNAEVQVVHYRGGPSGGHFAVGDQAADPYGNVAGRWSVLGDQISHTASNWGERPNPMKPAEWPLASSGETLLGSMSISFAGRLHEVAEPKIKTARSLQFWTNTTAWMPWMEMGQRPGFNLWRWIGAKGTPANELDPALIALVETVCPGYVTHDGVWQVPTSGRVDYMRIKQGLPLTQ
jgi:Protein of unknown function (DUF1838)